MDTNGYQPNDISYGFNDLWGKTEAKIMLPTQKARSYKPNSSRLKEEIRRFGFRYYNRTEALASGFDWDDSV